MEEKNKLIEDAERRAKEIIEQAWREADIIVKEAERRYQQIAETERKRILEEAEKESSYVLTDAKRKASMIENKAKAEVIEELFKKAEDIMRQGAYDVKTSLRNLIVESMSQVDKPRKIIVREDQAEIARSILRELGYRDIVIETRNNMLGGVIVESEMGVVVDNRLETRLRQVRLNMLDKIAKILWG